MNDVATKTVLVVEDDTDIRNLLQTALEIEGYKVITAPNGKEAWDWLQLQENKASVIVLDLMMPVMDGWQFLDLKAASVRLKKIPTLVVSASSEKRIPPASHTQVVLQKPLDLQGFLNQVHHLSQMG
jgi:CheY-like chemotaxis protein